jgi:hypothetical protein
MIKKIINYISMLIILNFYVILHITIPLIGTILGIGIPIGICEDLDIIEKDIYIYMLTFLHSLMGIISIFILYLYANNINLNIYCLIYLVIFQLLNILIAYFHVKICGGWFYRN